MSARTDAIVEWLRQRLSRSGAHGFVVGLSGGVDSAVVARLCQAAAPANVLAVVMPCHSDPQDEVYARLLADHFGIPAVRVDLSPVHDVLVEDLRYLAEHLPEAQRAAAHPPDDLRARAPMANVKPRLRMTTLYFLANTLNYLVAGTGNRSELAIGYFTKHGDGGVDLLPIGHLLKGDVREAARELGVPEDILVRPPTAGLWAGQTDEEEMGFTYAELDACLAKGPEAVSPALAMRIERLVRQTEHKRAVPPTPDSST
jgi:NAD+ synthase